MQWDAVAAVGQAVSAVGGIAALLYLARQVKQNTLAVRSSSADVAINAINDWMGRLAGDAELERVWRAGMNDIAALPEDQRGRHFLLATMFLMHSENTHHHYRAGTLDPEAWESWRGKLAHNITQPGMREVWTIAGRGYSRPFREFVESVHASPATPLPFETLRTLGRAGPEVAESTTAAQNQNT